MISLHSQAIESKDAARRDCVAELCKKFGTEYKGYFEGIMNKYFVGEYDPYIDEKVKEILKSH